MKSKRNEVFEGLKNGLEEGLEYVKKGESKASKHRRFEKRVFKPTIKFDKDEIRQIRLKLGLSQPEMASLLGISIDTLRRWEQGINTITGPNARLLEIFSCRKHRDIIDDFELKEA